MPAVQRAKRPWGAGGRGRPPQPSPPSGLCQLIAGLPGLAGSPPGFVGAGRGWGFPSPIVSSSGFPAGEGRRERGGGRRAPKGGFEPGGGIPAQLCRLPISPAPPGLEDLATLVSSLMEEPPGACPASCPFPGPFVPGKPDASSVAAPSRCLFQRQLSWQLLSPHNGVRTWPPRIGSGEVSLSPRLSCGCLGMCYFRGEKKKCFPWDSIRAAFCGLPAAHLRFLCGDSSGRLRLWISRPFSGGT